MSKKPKNKNHFTDFLTSLMLTLSLVIGVYFVFIFQQPLSVLNPFPPIEGPMELPGDLISYALTETIANIPTSTPTPESTSTTANTLTPKPTQISTQTTVVEVNLIPSATADPEKVIFQTVAPDSNVDQIFYTPTAKPIADYLFDFALLHEPEAQQSPWNNFVSNPILNCNWFGVGGQVFDFQGRPITGVRIKLGGTYPDDDEFIELYTETAYEHVQGEGGYEFKLSDEPISTSSFWVQVIDEDGYAISSKAHFTITAYCTVNLIRIDFVQVK